MYILYNMHLLYLHIDGKTHLHINFHCLSLLCLATSVHFCVSLSVWLASISVFKRFRIFKAAASDIWPCWSTWHRIFVNDFNNMACAAWKLQRGYEKYKIHIQAILVFFLIIYLMRNGKQHHTSNLMVSTSLIQRLSTCVVALPWLPWEGIKGTKAAPIPFLANRKDEDTSDISRRSLVNVFTPWKICACGHNNRRGDVLHFHPASKSKTWSTSITSVT